MLANNTIEDTEVAQWADYYPFGMVHRRSRTLADDNQRLYSGKEFENDFGLDWYNYGARFYDAQIGRFLSADRLSSEFPYWSHYAYAANRPTTFIDLDGLEPALYVSAYNGTSNQSSGYIQAKKMMGERPNPSVVNALQKNELKLAKTSAITISCIAPIARIAYLGYSAAAIQGFNTTAAAFEVVGVQGPLLMKATSELLGGDIEGNTLPTQILYEVGANKTASITDLAIDITSIVKGANPQTGTDILNLVNDILGTYQDGTKVQESTIKQSEQQKQAQNNQHQKEETPDNKEKKQ